eukprot:gene26943-59438_t
MGKVRTKTVKKASKLIVEKYYTKLTMDFHVNKKLISEVSVIPSRRLRNKISGFTTHLMKRIARGSSRGPVRGISLKLQEEERERRMDFIQDGIDVDDDTYAMLKRVPHTWRVRRSLKGMDMQALHNLRKTGPARPAPPPQPQRGGGKGRN